MREHSPEVAQKIERRSLVCDALELIEDTQRRLSWRSGVAGVSLLLAIPTHTLLNKAASDVYEKDRSFSISSGEKLKDLYEDERGRSISPQEFTEKNLLDKGYVAERTFDTFEFTDGSDKPTGEAEDNRYTVYKKPGDASAPLYLHEASYPNEAATANGRTPRESWSKQHPSWDLAQNGDLSALGYIVALIATASATSALMFCIGAIGTFLASKSRSMKQAAATLVENATGENPSVDVKEVDGSFVFTTKPFEYTTPGKQNSMTRSREKEASLKPVAFDEWQRKQLKAAMAARGKGASIVL